MLRLTHYTFFLFIFMSALIIPSIIMLHSLAHDETSETKKAFNSTAPLFLKMKAFTHSFSKKVNDNFPFAEELFSTNSWINYRHFNSSIKNQQVILGKEGWLFYRDENVLKQYTPYNQLSEIELQLIKQNLIERKEYFDSLNISYMIAIVPNKHSVYDEYLPNWAQAHLFKSRIGDVTSILQKITIPHVDLTSDLRAKKAENLYKKTDTHWNDKGALVGYQAIFDMLIKNSPDLPLYSQTLESEITIRDSVEHGGDLARLLGLKSFIWEKSPHLQFPRNEVEKKQHDSYEEYQNKNGNGLSIFIFRDSFTSAMRPFFKNDFTRTFLRWDHQINRSYIENEHPDLVLHVITERYLHQLAVKDKREQSHYIFQ